MIFRKNKILLPFYTDSEDNVSLHFFHHNQDSKILCESFKDQQCHQKCLKTAVQTVNIKKLNNQDLRIYKKN